jgi:hypothetical protein
MEACDQTRPGLGGERRRWLETAASRAESSTDHTERTRWWICKEKCWTMDQVVPANDAYKFPFFSLL